MAQAIIGMKQLAGGELWNGYIDDLAEPNCQMYFVWKRTKKQL